MTKILTGQQVTDACVSYQSGTPVTALAKSFNVSHQAILGLMAPQGELEDVGEDKHRAARETVARN